MGKTWTMAMNFGNVKKSEKVYKCYKTLQNLQIVQMLQIVQILNIERWRKNINKYSNGSPSGYVTLTWPTCPVGAAALFLKIRPLSFIMTKGGISSFQQRAPVKADSFLRQTQDRRFAQNDKFLDSRLDPRSGWGQASGMTENKRHEMARLRMQRHWIPD